jgi:hypothetical protein
MMNSIPVIPPGGEKAIYIAKYAFTGQKTESKLSFIKESRIVAAPNKTGEWWWGTCDGRDGLFPPTFVTLAQMQPQPGVIPPEEGRQYTCRP